MVSKAFAARRRSRTRPGGLWIDGIAMGGGRPRRFGAAAMRYAFIFVAGIVSLRVVVSRADPQYWNPQTAVDYLAVALTSAVFLGLAMSFGMLGINLWRAGFMMTATALAVAAVAGGLVGVANFLEDALQMKVLFGVYPFLFLPLLIGLVVAAFACLSRAGMRVLGLALILGVVALVAMVMEPLGGLLLIIDAVLLGMLLGRAATPPNNVGAFGGSGSRRS